VRQVKIEKDEDQNTNDFEKAVILAHRLNFKTLACIGVLGGRIDQELCNLSAIEKYSKLLNLKFIAFGSSSMMVLVRPGEETVIRPGKGCILNQVGLFCFGRARVNTNGLRWNLSS
jgi:thiamine pyrophosphokinase